MVTGSHQETNRRLSMSGISTPLKNGSLEPSGSSQGDGRGGGDVLSGWLFSIQSKGNKIAANERSLDHFRTPFVFR